jgi:PAS domain S-box-containing protein
MVCLLTPDYHVAFANRAFREKFGPSEGMYCYDYCFGKKEPCSFCESFEVLETGEPHHWEVNAPDGSVFDAYDFPFRDVDGSPLILEMDIDITAWRKIEEQLRASSLYSRNLIEASLDPLVTISADGKITDVNKATETVTGCSRDELIDSDFFSYFTEPEKARAGYITVFADGFVRDYPLAIRSKSGKITQVSYNATVYKNEAGVIQGVFAAARDITELKKAERVAQESEKKLRDAERLAAIGATAGMVGHDIRNPLQAITSDVYLIKSNLASIPCGEEREEMEESLSGIEKNIAYINKIVQDLQDYARPVTVAAREMDLKDLFEDVLSSSVIPENIEATCKVEKNTKKIFSDSDVLLRILNNLVGNAVQAMPEGGKLVLATYEQGEDIAVIVSDTGKGIPEEIRSKLFTPLFTTKSKGQGFGLAVVKRLVEALGGTVAFKSEVGKGTEFVIRLPQKELTG